MEKEKVKVKWIKPGRVSGKPRAIDKVEDLDTPLAKRLVEKGFCEYHDPEAEAKRAKAEAAEKEELVKAAVKKELGKAADLKKLSVPELKELHQKAKEEADLETARAQALELELGTEEELAGMSLEELNALLQDNEN